MSVQIGFPMSCNFLIGKTVTPAFYASMSAPRTTSIVREIMCVDPLFICSTVHFHVLVGKFVSQCRKDCGANCEITCSR